MCLKILQPQFKPLRDFATYADLEAWYELHNELAMDPPNLCDDYSREARALAELDGYDLSLCLVGDGTCYGTQLFPAGTWHIGNLAVVTGSLECWYVDLNWRKLVKLCDIAPGGKY
jgi:hypothetical protein